ncbi:MAG: hypothetical protein ACRCVK_08595 [Aeromonas veronii]
MCQGVLTEHAASQGVKPLAMGSLVGGKQVYLSLAEVLPDQLDCLGMEPPFARKWRLP